MLCASSALLQSLCDVWYLPSDPRLDLLETPSATTFICHLPLNPISTQGLSPKQSSLQAQIVVDMDDLTADLAPTLQLQDLRELENHTHGTTTDASNARLAIELYRDQLRQEALLVTDHRFGQKVGQASGSRPTSLVNSTTPRFDDLFVHSRRQRTESTSANSQDGPIDIQHAHQGNETSRAGSPDGSVDASPAHTNPKVNSSSTSHSTFREPAKTCVICEDQQTEHQEFLEVPCGDHYCTNCINRLFELATNDESLFPPRCCQEVISPEVTGRFLRWEVQKTFEEKVEEFSTLNRTCCHVTDCAKFISPTRIDGERAFCTVCPILKCTICKGPFHDGEDRPQDPAVQALMAFATVAGYQQCKSCKRMIELGIGWYHIT